MLYLHVQSKNATRGWGEKRGGKSRESLADRQEVIVREEKGIMVFY
jgi:hypothetical protein